MNVALRSRKPPSGKVTDGYIRTLSPAGTGDLPAKNSSLEYPVLSTGLEITASVSGVYGNLVHVVYRFPVANELVNPFRCSFEFIGTLFQYTSHLSNPSSVATTYTEAKGCVTSPCCPYPWNTYIGSTYFPVDR